jgi:hypothetical protein
LVVHLFRGPNRVFAVTAAQDGSNLPEKYAPWTFFKTIELERGKQTPGLNAEECLDDLEVHGLHVTDAHVRITDQAMRRPA